MADLLIHERVSRRCAGRFAGVLHAGHGFLSGVHASLPTEVAAVSKAARALVASGELA